QDAAVRDDASSRDRRLGSGAFRRRAVDRVDGRAERKCRRGGVAGVDDTEATPSAASTPDSSSDRSADATEDGGVEALLERVKERGFVTTGEIFAAFPGLEPETAELAAIYSGISARGVQVVDEIAEELEREDQRRGTPESRSAHRGRTSEPGRSSGVVTRPGTAPTTKRASRVGNLGAPGSPRERAGEIGSFDPVRIDLKEIGKVPLLTAEQEVTLAQRIEAGLPATERLELEPNLTEEAQASLEAVATDGQLAKRPLTEANLRLVVSIAKRHVRRRKAPPHLPPHHTLALLPAL